MSCHLAGWILLFVLYATFEHPFVNGQTDETNLENKFRPFPLLLRWTRKPKPKPKMQKLQQNTKSADDLKKKRPLFFPGILFPQGRSPYIQTIPGKFNPKMQKLQQNTKSDPQWIGGRYPWAQREREFFEELKIQERFDSWLLKRERNGDLKNTCYEFDNILLRGQHEDPGNIPRGLRRWVNKHKLIAPQKYTWKNYIVIIQGMRSACETDPWEKRTKLSAKKGTGSSIAEAVRREIQKYKAWLKKSSQSGELKRVCQTIALSGISTLRSSEGLLDEFLQWIRTLYSLAPENKYFHYVISVFKNLKQICGRVNTAD